MPRFAVRPDDLEDAAALTGSEVPSLDTARRLVALAAGEAVGALGSADSVLAAAVEGYTQVESVMASAISEAATVLSGALASGAGGYARTDSGTALALRSAFGERP
jgi:Excreted virulence factor EspC, type VII ESX diderm